MSLACPRNVCAIILNFNGWRDSVECLDSLFKCADCPWQIIVCDNNSTDDSAAQMKGYLSSRGQPKDSISDTVSTYFVPLEVLENREHGVTVTLIENSENQGFSAGNNVAIRFAISRVNCKYLWLLNNDAVVENGSLSAMLAEFKFNPRLGICGSRLMYFDRRYVVQSLGMRVNEIFGTTKHVAKGLDIRNTDGRRYIPERVPQALCGASLIISVECVRNVGLLPEVYFYYYEDVDLCYRAVKLGYKIAVCWDSVVYHKQGRSIGALEDKEIHRPLSADYHSIRGRLLFMRRFFPSRMVFVYLGMIIAIFNRIKRRQLGRVFMIISLVWDDFWGSLHKK